MAITKDRLLIYTTDIDEGDYDKSQLQDEMYWMGYEEEGYEDYDELPDNLKWELLDKVNDAWGWAEWDNLNCTIDGTIIAIRDVGRWDGGYRGIAEISDNLRDILQDTIASMAYYDWYIDETDDVCQVCVHHDGRNHTRYRWVEDKDALYEMIEADWDDQDRIIEEHTHSLYPLVADIYGWPINKSLDN